MSELDVIESTLAAVGPYVLERYADREDLVVRTKRDANDLLTEVDEEAQRRVTRCIHEHFPDDRIVGEELGMDVYPEDLGARCWVVDPIDGTQNFLRGLYPIFGISIAFVVGGRTQAGGVLLPVTDDLFLATRGGGATRNGLKLGVSSEGRLEMARVEVDLGNGVSRERGMGLFLEVLKRSGQVRCVCAAVVGLCSVATGDADAYFNAGLSPWDYAAAALIVEEAGGRVTRLDGDEVELFDGRWGMLATNGPLHAAGLGAIDWSLPSGVDAD